MKYYSKVVATNKDANSTPVAWSVSKTSDGSIIKGPFIYSQQATDFSILLNDAYQDGCRAVTDSINRVLQQES